MKKIKTKIQEHTKFMSGHRNNEDYMYKELHIHDIYKDNDGKIYDHDIGVAVEVDESEEDNKNWMDGVCTG